MKLSRLFCLLLFLPMLAGCLPDSGPVDDEKDPHFQEGRNLVNSQDFSGAAEEFEKALQANPHSAAAHFELALLCERRQDWAAAIYHYERVLALEPNSPHAQTARDRIRGCREALATAVFPLPNSQNLQREVDQLTDENARLRQQMDSLRAQLAVRPTVAAAPTPAPAVTPIRAAADPASGAAPPPAPAPGARGKVYVVRAGDTIAAIARENGVKPNAVLAANPGVNPRRLRVGQTIRLP